MKRYLFAIFILYAAIPLFAQKTKSSTTKNDLIITTQSEKIEAFITEVSDETISYRKASNPNGPVFVLSTDKISTVLYANGEVQVIKHKAKTQAEAPAPREFKDAPIVNTREVKQEQKTETEESESKQTKPYFTMDGHLRGEVGGLGKGQQTVGGIGGDLEAGIMLFNNRNFLGIGIAADAIFGKVPVEKAGKIQDAMATSWSMPIYACDRIYFSSSSTAPYLDLALGGYVNLAYEVSGSKSEKAKGGGLYFRPGLGLAISTPSSLYVHINVGYELRYSEIEGNEAKSHSIYFRIGLGGR